jgi:hypothetical protein
MAAVTLGLSQVKLCKNIKPIYYIDATNLKWLCYTIKKGEIFIPPLQLLI